MNRKAIMVGVDAANINLNDRYLIKKSHPAPN
jgi:hypothetical protein